MALKKPKEQVAHRLTAQTRGDTEGETDRTAGAYSVTRRIHLDGDGEWNYSPERDATKRAKSRSIDRSTELDDWTNFEPKRQKKEIAGADEGGTGN